MADCEYPGNKYVTEPFIHEQRQIYLEIIPVRTPTGKGETDPTKPCVLSGMLNNGQFGLTNTRRCERCNCIVTVLAAEYPYDPAT